MAGFDRSYQGRVSGILCWCCMCLAVASRKQVHIAIREVGCQKTCLNVATSLEPVLYREKIMYPLQRLSTPALDAVMWFLGQFCSADVMIPYFTALYWCLDKHKCVEGVWLIPISEIVNGALKWYYQVPRPGWVDPKIQLKAWSHEWSFPSSHSQIIWALVRTAAWLRNVCCAV